MIINGDCLIEMAKMPQSSIDFIVTDPPYGLKFMGKEWDRGVPGVPFWTEALRICKPGSWIAAFGGTRTHHHLMCAIEDSGWEIRDCMMWLYGSGFPKSNNKFGLEGYGTALKPAWEPIILAMKPFDGTFAQNAEKWSLAGINIDESRIGTDQITTQANKGHRQGFEKGFVGCEKNIHTGRWPANLILDEEAGEILNKQSGILKSGSGDKHNKTQLGGYHGNFGLMSGKQYQSDFGGASRFFYCAKASPKEKGLGNAHPTVKPLSLMKYIIKLLAPPGNPVVLDPFCGSGSTLLAAKELGIKYIGIEISKEYCEIAENRLRN